MNSPPTFHSYILDFFLVMNLFHFILPHIRFKYHVSVLIFNWLSNSYLANTIVCLIRFGNGVDLRMEFEARNSTEAALHEYKAG
jgi:hypothetical protein